MGNILKPSSADAAIQAIRNRTQLPFIVNQGQQTFGGSLNNQLTVLSYNILADEYKKVFLFTVPWKYLDFNYRSRIIIEELKAFSADIICLQEVDHFHDFYQKELENLGYEVMYKQKTKRKDGVLIGTKKDVFERIRLNTLHFDKGHKYDNRKEFVRGTVAIIATMKHKPSGKIVNIINTHLFWDPKFEHVRYLQISQIYKHIRKNFDEKDIVIFAGDLNSKPESNTVKYILENEAPQVDKDDARWEEKTKIMEELYEDLQKKPVSTKFHSAFSLYGNFLNDETFRYPKYTNYTTHFKNTVDHMFFTGDNLIMKDLMRIPTVEEIVDNGLPNWRYPSDHLPLLARFEFLDMKSKL